MRPAAALIALLGLSATACEFEFTEPSYSRAHERTSLHVRVKVTDSLANDRAEIDASLLPGLDEAGRRRRFANDTLYVLGLALTPQEVTEDGRIQYRGSVPIEAAGEGSVIRVRPPTINGIASAPLLEIERLRRVGADCLASPADTPIELRVAGVGRNGESTRDNLQWMVKVVDARNGREMGRIQANGPPPTPLRVPAPLFSAARDSTVGIWLRLARASGASSGDGLYSSSIFLESHLYWLVRLSEP